MRRMTKTHKELKNNITERDPFGNLPFKFGLPFSISALPLLAAVNSNRPTVYCIRFQFFSKNGTCTHPQMRPKQSKQSAGWQQLKKMSFNRKVTCSIPAILFDRVKYDLRQCFSTFFE